MQTLDHPISKARPPGQTQRRVTGLVFAGLLQAAAVWALIVGLHINVWPTPMPPPGQIFPGEKIPPRQPPPLPTHWVNPVEHPLPPPIFTVDDGQDRGTTTITPYTGPQTQPGDHYAVGIGATHTTPPYPPLAIRLEEQGSVQLRLTISPQGFVTDAIVVRSSGHEDLDQAARNWVVARWRYQPAVRGGAAVPSTVDAVVKFDLKNAG